MFGECFFLLLTVFAVFAEPSLRELLDLLNSPPEGDILLRVRRQRGLDDFTKEDLWWLKMGEERAAMAPDQTFGTLTQPSTVVPINGTVGATTVDATSGITNGTVGVNNTTIHVTKGITNGTVSFTNGTIYVTSGITNGTGYTTNGTIYVTSGITNGTGYITNGTIHVTSGITNGTGYITNGTIHVTNGTSSITYDTTTSANGSISITTIANGSSHYYTQPSTESSIQIPISNSSFPQTNTSSVASVNTDSSNDMFISLSTKPSNPHTTQWIFPNQVPEDRYLIRTVFNNMSKLTDDILRDLKDALQNAYKMAFSKHMQRHFERKDSRNRRVPTTNDIKKLPERLRRSIQGTEVRIHNVSKSGSAVTLIYSVYSEEWPVDAKVAVQDMSYLSEQELLTALLPYNHVRTEPVLGEVNPVVSKPPASQYWVIGAVLGPLLLIFFLLALLLYVCKRPKSVSSARKRVDPETPSKQQVYPAAPTPSSKSLSASHSKSKGTPLFEKRVTKRNGTTEDNTDSLDLDVAEKSAMSLAGEAAVKTRKRRAHRMRSSDSGMTRSSADTDYSFVVASDSDRYTGKQALYPTAPLRPAMITSPTPDVKYTYVEVYPQAKSITTPLQNYQPNAEVEVSIEVEGGSKQVTENYLIGGGGNVPQGEDGFQKIKKRVQELLDEALKLFGNYPSVGNVRSYDIAGKKEEPSTVKPTVSSYGDAKPAWSLASPSTPDSAFGEDTRPIVSERMTPVNQPLSPEPHPLSVPSSPKAHRPRSNQSQTGSDTIHKPRSTPSPTDTGFKAHKPRSTPSPTNTDIGLKAHKPRSSPSPTDTDTGFKAHQPRSSPSPTDTETGFKAHKPPDPDIGFKAQKPRSNSSPTDTDTGLKVGDPAIPVIKAIRHELKKYNSQ